MTFLRSVRSRVIVGSVLWAAGLSAVAHVAAFSLASRYPHSIRLAHGVLISILALLCIVAGLAGVRSGLSPLAVLRARLGAVRDGRAKRLEGTYPTEVEPLVEDLNSLIEDREARVARAVARAGDLAHGLKTPLAVLVQEAERARDEGHPEHAEAILEQVERMRRQIEVHLAHARASSAATTGGTAASLLDSAEGLRKTMERIHGERALRIDLRVARHHRFRGRREDLDEMLGNLVDNACRWAVGHIVVESEGGQNAVAITVDDDGPGLDASMRDVVLQRGVRADEAAPGSGLGLAIVRDLAELYGGSIALDDSPLGGLRATLRLPGTVSNSVRQGADRPGPPGSSQTA